MIDLASVEGPEACSEPALRPSDPENFQRESKDKPYSTNGQTDRVPSIVLVPPLLPHFREQSSESR